jgi:cytochrome c oxidase subunit II
VQATAPLEPAQILPTAAGCVARVRLRRAVELLGRCLAGVALLSVCACSSSPTFLRPEGSDAAEVRGLWWILFTAAAIIFVIVVAILVIGAIRRPSTAEELRAHPFGTPLVWIGGIIVPLLVLAGVFGLSIARMVNYNTGSPDLTIDVIGHQWWWEVRYPDDNVVTANEIHIPVGQRAHIVLTSQDVIHAFWVPALQGKIDAIPGMTNTLALEANTPGTYRGECLTYCGLQHANMNLLVIAQPADQFQDWLSAQSATPPAPTDPQLLHGQQVFLNGNCVYCHTIAGTAARGQAGPDLTHMESRQQLAAGAISNTPGALGGWIVDAQTIKPGNAMPPQEISGPDLQALISYLESLK